MRQRLGVLAVVRQLIPVECRSICGCTGNGSFAAWPVRWTIRQPLSVRDGSWKAGHNGRVSAWAQKLGGSSSPLLPKCYLFETGKSLSCLLALPQKSRPRSLPPRPPSPEVGAISISDRGHSETLEPIDHTNCSYRCNSVTYGTVVCALRDNDGTAPIFLPLRAQAER